MIKNILILTTALLISPYALAQEYGALLGVHQTSADSGVTGTSIDGVFNFKAGLAVGFALSDNAKFRTGLLYNQRHVETNTSGVKGKVNFDYLDVPALVQFNVNEMFGLFGGLVVGINVSDDTKPKATNVDAKALIPLLNLGMNLMFQDMIGFDVYYERGMGQFAKNLENYGTFGANFIYWF